MSTQIASLNPGRSLASYDLLDELTEKYGLDRREAHEGIHGLLNQLVEIDGEDAVVLSQTPMRPELMEHNWADVDVDSWIEISDDAVEAIRESFAATHANADLD